MHAAQVVAATAKATLQEGQAQGDIELHPQRVAQVVQQAKAAEEMQQVAKQGAATEPTTAAEKYKVSAEKKPACHKQRCYTEAPYRLP